MFCGISWRSTANRAAVLSTTRDMTHLIALIQRYPDEARRIMAAMDDGLILGPAQPMSDEMERAQLAERVEAKTLGRF